jgi:hypothetical protein
MPKHKLSLDSLEVESFAPDPNGQGLGTVHGYVYTRDTNWQCASCAETCNLYDYCTNGDYTCASCRNCPSANGTCGGTTCAGTCNACTDGYTCINTCGAYSCICSVFCNSIDVCETEAC